jgi:hypothetical protein
MIAPLVDTSEETRTQVVYNQGCEDTKKKYDESIQPLKDCFLSYFEKYLKETGIDIERDFLRVLPMVLDAVLYSNGDMRMILFNLYGKLPEDVYSLFVAKSASEYEINEKRIIGVNSLQEQLKGWKDEADKRVIFLQQQLKEKNVETQDLEREFERIARLNEELKQENAKKLKLIQCLQDRLDGVNNSGQQIG